VTNPENISYDSNRTMPEQKQFYLSMEEPATQHKFREQPKLLD